MSTHEFTTSNELPLLAIDKDRGGPTQLFIEQIKQLKKSSTVEFVQFFSRREWLFAITYPDHQFYFSHLVNTYTLPDVNTKVYFVSCSYCHAMLIVDPIDEDGKFSSYNEAGYTLHKLPNGQSYTLPRKSSVIGLKSSVQIVDSAFGYDKKILASFDKGNFGEIIQIKDLETLLRPDEFVTYMSSAAYTSIFVTSQGRILLTGSNGFGELGVSGIDKSEKIFVQPLCEENPSLFFCKVACGDHNIFAITKEGLVYVTGYNASNEL